MATERQYQSTVGVVQEVVPPRQYQATNAVVQSTAESAATTSLIYRRAKAAMQSLLTR